MTPQDFIAKWRPVELKERSAAQSHFNDLCRLLGLDDPIAADPKGDWFTFEYGVSKASGGEGWADVWRRDCFGWEYKGKHRDLDDPIRTLALDWSDIDPSIMVTRAHQNDFDALVSTVFPPKFNGRARAA